LINVALWVFVEMLDVVYDKPSIVKLLWLCNYLDNFIIVLCNGYVFDEMLD